MCALFCSQKLKMATKLRTEYGPVLHMPVLKEGRSKAATIALDPYSSSGYTSVGKREDFFLRLLCLWTDRRACVEL